LNLENTTDHTHQRETRSWCAVFFLLLQFPVRRLTGLATLKRVIERDCFVLCGQLDLTTALSLCFAIAIGVWCFYTSGYHNQPTFGCVVFIGDAAIGEGNSKNGHLSKTPKIEICHNAIRAHLFRAEIWASVSLHNNLSTFFFTTTATVQSSLRHTIPTGSIPT
jgi:hypothetical protein